MSTETCIVRPELIEFKKNVADFFTIAANADGFKFMRTAAATNESDPSDLIYDFLSPDGIVGTGNLASVWMDKLHVRDLELGAGDASGGGSSLQNIETITMTRNVQGNIFMQNGFISNVERFYDLEHLIMRTNDNALIDMNNGDIRQVRDMAFMPDATIDANSAAMSNLDTIVFSANVGTNGPHSKISNLATLDMVSGDNARINMTDGHIEMPGSSAVANIGDLLIYNNIIRNDRSENDVSTHSVRIENTDIVDSTMYLSNIDGLYTDKDTMPTAPVRVVDAVFTYSGMPDPLGESRDLMPGIMTVEKVQTDIIEPKANLQGNANDNNLTLRARGNDGLIKLERVGTGAPIRINNLAEPIDNTDAANKAYVQNIMDRNIQGLKPKEACDTTLFAPGYANVGGYALGSTNADSDTDPVFSGDWCITHTPNSDGNVDTSDMFLYLPVDASTDTVSIGNVAYEEAVLNAYNFALESNVEGTDPKIPERRRIRILFNGFNASTSGLALATPPGGGGTLLSDMTGINGIWEVYKSETENDSGTDYFKITLRRAADMNESHEAMNGAYVYIRDSNSPGQKHKNTAFVVQAPNDPIGISTTTDKGMTVRDDGTVVQLKWVTFNTVNYELDFVNVNGHTKEFIDESVTFRRGGIAMKYDPSDDKKVMVDSEKLRYDVTTHDLHINGNITFSELTTGNADVYIQHDGNIIQNTPDNYVIEINGSKLYDNVEGPYIDTQFVNCQTVTCASDNRLKKNVEPITNGLDLLSKLGAVTYNWNTAPEGADPDYGFIAQQLEENFPSLVSTNHHTGYKAVDYMKITSILAAAVQELAAKVGAQ